MPNDTDTTTGRSRVGTAVARGPLDNMDNLDRILLGACAAIWLAALGAIVAAAVALVDLGRARPQTPEASETPWLLYTVIAVSAVVIAGAVPLLLRARRSAFADPPAVRVAADPAAADPVSREGEPATEKLQTLRATPTSPRYASAPHRQRFAGPLAAAIDRVWLRCALGIGCAMGVAMVAIGVATYLMAVDRTMAAWIVYGVAGVITLGMPAIPWFSLRQLHTVLDGAKA